MAVARLRGARTAAHAALRVTTIALGAAALGAALAAAAAPFGNAAPVVLIALAVLPALMLAVLHDARVGVVAVFAAFPASSLSIPTGVFNLEAVEAVVLLVAVLVAVRRLGAGATMLPWAPALWWALGLLGWTIVALPSAVDRTLALKQTATLAGGLVFSAVVLAACRNLRDLRLILGSFVGVATAMAAAALAGGGDMQASFGGAVVKGRLAGVFDHPNQLAALCAVAALVATGLALGARSRRTRISGGVAIAILAAALMLSLSRGAWIGALLGILFLLVTLPRARRAVALGAVPLVLVAIAFGSSTLGAPQIQILRERAQALTVRSPYDTRSQIWAEAQREIRADPWTGQGPGTFPVASLRAGSEASTVFAYHAHNLWLTWAAETGLPGASAIVGLTLALAAAGRTATARAGDRHDRAVVAGIGAALVAVLGQGLVDYTLRNQVIFFAVWGLIGALVSAAQAPQRASAGGERQVVDEETPPSTSRRDLERERAALL